MSAAPVLNILRDGEAVASAELKGELLLGRSEDCAIRLDDRAVSRHHAVLRPVPGGMQVERRSEFAPIRVNGEECTHAVVKQGDVVEIGPYRLRLAAAAATAALAPEPSPLPAIAEVIQAAPDEITASLEPLPEAEAYPSAESPEEFEALMPLEGLPSPEGAGQETVALEPFAGEAAAAENSPSPVEEFALTLDPPADAAPIDAGPVEIAVGENSDTRLAPPEAFDAKLVFGPEDANVTELPVGDREISIGRGKECDAVLNNRKASRKHAVIRRVDGRFVLEDLGSANGTYVNGKKIRAYELTGDDRIRIGGQEFAFRVTSPDYARQEAGFVPVDDATAMAGGPPDFAGAVDLSTEAPSAVPPPPPAALAGVASGEGGTLGGVMGIPGLETPVQNRSLIEKFRALPPRRQVIWAVIVAALFYFLLIDEDPPPAPPAKPVAAAKKPAAETASGPTFESLTPEQRRFVEAQHALAFDHYKNREYDKALFEIRKIFALINDYKDSREIERYALEGKRKLEAIEEERKRREEEARLKARVAQLVDEARAFMEKRDYAAAKELFYDILAIEPDNAQVADWKREIEAWEEEQRLKETQRQVEAEINRRAWEEHDAALVLKKSGQCRAAIPAFARIPDLGATDKKVLASAERQIRACRAEIAARRDPLLAQAREAEDAGELKRAFELYRKATRVDPDHSAGFAGMARIRDRLRERSRVLYAEGVMAESYSDFVTAKRKFTEVLAQSPDDDLYHERARRKLSNYYDREPASE